MGKEMRGERHMRDECVERQTREGEENSHALPLQFPGSTPARLLAAASLLRQSRSPVLFQALARRSHLVSPSLGGLPSITSQVTRHFILCCRAEEPPYWVTCC